MTVKHILLKFKQLQKERTELTIPFLNFNIWSKFSCRESEAAKATDSGNKENYSY